MEELKELRLSEIYRALNLPKQKYTFFSIAHRIFSRIYSVLGHHLIYIYIYKQMQLFYKVTSQTIVSRN